MIDEKKQEEKEDKEDKEQSALIDLTFMIAIGFALSYFYGYINFIRFLSEFNVFYNTFPMITAVNLPTEYFVFNGVRFFIILLIPIGSLFFGYRRNIWNEKHPHFFTFATPYITWHIVLTIFYIYALIKTQLVSFPFWVAIRGNLIILVLMLFLLKFRNIYQRKYSYFLVICFIVSFAMTSILAMDSGNHEANILKRKLLKHEGIEKVEIELKQDCPIKLGKSKVIFAQSENAIYIVSEKNGEIGIYMVAREYVKFIRKKQR